MTEPRIIIVGAGISGLAAADRLINKHGFKNVTILEASDRIGGRICPVPIATDSFIQLGAEWLHNRYNPLFDMAVQLGLVQHAKVKPVDFLSGIRFIDENGDDVPQELKNAYLKHVYGKLDELLDHGSFDGYDSSSFGNLMDHLLRRLVETGKYTDKDVKILWGMHSAVRSSMEHYHAANDWHAISLGEYLHPPEIDSTPFNDKADDESRIAINMNRFGYKSILDEMIKKIPPDCIKLNSCVTCIHWIEKTAPGGQKNVQIDLANGQSICADHVIMTCSLGHLKKYAEKLFNPPLPEQKMQAIKAYGFDTVDKLMLIFEEPFWPKDTFVLNFIRNDEKREKELDFDPDAMFQVVFASEVHSNVLNAWINGQDTAAFENTPDIQVAEAASKILRKYFKNPLIPVPRILRSSWNTNPLFHGSYSYNSTDANRLNCRRTDLSEPLTVSRGGNQVPVVLFAGEATNPKQYATTHGAFATGIREADRLSELYKRSADSYP